MLCKSQLQRVCLLFGLKNALKAVVCCAVCVQFDALKGYLDNGGAALLMLAEGGEKELGTNVEFLTEQ